MRNTIRTRLKMILAISWELGKASTNIIITTTIRHPRIRVNLFIL